MKRPFLRVEGLRSGYGPVEVLHGVDLTVGEGEVVAVLGPNGAGKTTLLRTLVGLTRRRFGTVMFDDGRVDGKAPEQMVAAGMTLVPEGRHVFPDLSVAENLRMGAYIVSDQKIVNERTRAMFERFPRLYERRSQAAGTLSGGEQQQLAIARALMGGPRLLLLDEPSLGLAPVLVEVVFDLIASLNAEGMTIVLVEQNVHQALAIARRAYVLASGVVTLSGSAEEFQQRHLEDAYLGGE